MRIGFAIGLLLAFFACSCESLWGAGEEESELEEPGRDLSSGDILEDMLDFVIEDSDTFQGRKKKQKKKLVKYLAGALLFKALLLPKILALVKFITAKAYLLSILALVAAAAVTSKKKEPDTEQIINLMPKRRTPEGQGRAYRYWRRRRSQPEATFDSR